eukprot:1593964-Amphidinium_carterae.1
MNKSVNGIKLALWVWSGLTSMTSSLDARNRVEPRRTGHQHNALGFPTSCRPVPPETGTDAQFYAFQPETDH